MSLGSVIGQDYTLPGVPGYQAGGFIGPSQAEQAAEQAQFAPAQGQAILPGLDAELAQIEGMTDEYYDTYSKLKSYVTEMNRLGIDVTKPDFTKPGGGDEFKTYKMFEAGLLRTANRLKNEYKLRQQLEPLRAKDQIRDVEGFDSTRQLYSETPGAYFSTQLLPEVQQAQDKLAEQLYTKGDVDRYNSAFFDIKNPNSLMSKLSQRLQQTTDPTEKAQLEYNMKALVQAVQKTDYVGLRPSGSTTTLKPSDISFAKRFANLQTGAINEDEVNFSFNNDGSTSAYSTELAGLNYGNARIKVKSLKSDGTETESEREVNRVISGLSYDEDGNVYLEFEQSGDYEIPREKITNMAGSTLLKKLVADNSNLGPKLMDILEQQGLITDLGDLDYEKLVTNKGADIKKVVKEKAKQVRQADASLSSVIDSVVPGKFWRGEAVEIPLSDGRVMSISKGGSSGKYYVDNYLELGLTESQAEKITKEQLINLVKQFYADDIESYKSAFVNINESPTGSKLDDPNNPLNN